MNRKTGGNDIPDFPTQAGMESRISLLKNLGGIKKECIYLDWKDGDWITFDTNTTTHERAALADVLHIQNRLTFVTVQLEYNHPAVSSDERSSTFKAYKNDPIREQMISLENYAKTKTFVAKIQTAVPVVEKYSKPTE